MRIERVARTAQDTQALGEALAGSLEPGDVVALTGELGAGKTTLVQGIARGLEVTAPVVSPTFTLVREYAGRLPVHHVDVYRLERLQDVIDLGFDEMVDSGGVTLVEWGDVIEGLLSGDHLVVELLADPRTEVRTVGFTGSGVSWTARWQSLSKAIEAVP